MGKYCTTTTLETNMVGVNFTTTTHDLGQKAIEFSENLINKYLSKRYDLSSSTFQTSVSIPPMIRSICEDMAEGRMWVKLARGREETLKRGFGMIKSAKSCLIELQKYEVDLLNTAGSVITDFSQTAYRVLDNTSDFANTFNEDDPLEWVVDEDKLDAIESERS